MRALLTRVKKLDEHEGSGGDTMSREDLIKFESQVNSAFRRFIPFELADLEKFLIRSSEHCEIVQHMRSTAMPILPGLMDVLGIVRPRFFMFAWLWDKDPRIQEHLRVYRSVEELFQESFTHCEILNLTVTSFRHYQESYDLFRPYHYLMTMDNSSIPSIEESFTTATSYMTELEQLATIATKEYRAQSPIYNV
ncbi:hypothetical protein FRB90_009944 [Tulasnella sp. 427]|nr:hypothetical protein FRB90_009944 [Tulasnella sp. 427]